MNILCDIFDVIFGSGLVAPDAHKYTIPDDAYRKPGEPLFSSGWDTQQTRENQDPKPLND